MDTHIRLMTFVNKGSSFEADKGYNDDMVMNCVLFSWFVILFLYKSNRYNSERFIIRRTTEDDRR